MAKWPFFLCIVNSQLPIPNSHRVAEFSSLGVGSWELTASVARAGGLLLLERLRLVTERVGFLQERFLLLAILLDGRL